MEPKLARTGLQVHVGGNIENVQKTIEKPYILHTFADTGGSSWGQVGAMLGQVGAKLGQVGANLSQDGPT